MLLQIGPSTYNKNGGYPKLDHLKLHLPYVHKYPSSLSMTQTKNKPLRHRNSKIFAVSMQDITHAFQHKVSQLCNTKLKTLSYFPSCPFIYYYHKYNTSFNKPHLQIETMMY